MFIKDSDYTIVIKDEIFARVIQENPDIRLEAGLYAQKVVESYLRGKYDVVAIFSKVDDERDRDILIYCIDIALHLLSSRINPNQIPQIREDRYQAAISWLKMVARGDISPNLPILPAENITKSISIKSEEKQTFSF